MLFSNASATTSARISDVRRHDPVQGRLSSRDGKQHVSDRVLRDAEFPAAWSSVKLLLNQRWPLRRIPLCPLHQRWTSTFASLISFMRYNMSYSKVWSLLLYTPSGITCLRCNPGSWKIFSWGVHTTVRYLFTHTISFIILPADYDKSIPFPLFRNF